MSMRRSFECRTPGLGLLAAAAGLLNPAQPGRADDFNFTGACGDTGWFACCVVEVDGEPVGCQFDNDGDPIAFFFTSNWSPAPLCGDCCIITHGGTKPFAVCRDCAANAGTSLRSGWVSVVLWLLLPIAGLAGLLLLLGLLFG